MRKRSKADIRLKAYEDEANKALAASLKDSIRRLQDAVAAASARGNVATNAKARQGVFNAVTEQAEVMQEDMSAHLAKLTWSVAKDAHGQSTAELRESGKRGLVAYDPKRTERYFDYINPGNQERLAGVFTDRMNDNVLNYLRMGYVSVARQASVEGWTQAEANRALQDDWNKRTRNNNLYRFVDRSGTAWENARYFQMLTRTNASRVWQAAFADTLAENGFQYARIPDAYPTSCDICSAWAGRIIVVAGKSKDYPTRDEAEEAGVFHPNCMHTTLEYVDELLDKNELALQKEFPAPKDGMDDAEKMSEVRDKMDTERYVREDGMTREQAEVAVMRDHLIGQLRDGVSGNETADLVAQSLTDNEIRALDAYGIPSFEPAKKGEEPTWNRGSAGGIVHYDRNASPEEIAEFLQSDESVKHNKEVLAFADTLTSEERGVVNAYSEKENGEASKWNSALRFTGEETLSKADRDSVELLDSVIEKAPKFPEPTFRGMNFPDGANEYYRELSNLEIGEPFKEKGFLSTSVSKLTAYGYANENGTDRPRVMLEVHGKNGALITPMSAHKREREVLFTKKSEFKVVDRQQRKGVLYLVIEEA